MSLSRRQIMLAALAYGLSLLFVPALLTGFSGTASQLPYAFRSYLYALQLLAAVLLLYAIGAAVLSYSARSERHPPLFFGACIGLVTAICYVFLRSQLNTWLGLPLTRAELFIVAAGIAYYQGRKIRASGQWRELLLPAAVLLPLLVALAQHELPRITMLSSDPDQHAFFAARIVALGGIPFSQGAWGDLSFGYPSGTGAFITVLSSLAWLSIPDATSVFPMLQAYLAIFLLAEIATRQHSRRIEFLCLVGISMLFHYWLTYGMEPAHYHLEGYGRLSSLWLTAIALGLLFSRHDSLQMSSAALLTFTGAILFVGASINPVNIFFTGVLLALAFAMRYPRKSWQLGALALLIPALCLDPYYFELLTGATRTGGIEHTSTHRIDLSAGAWLSATIERLPTWLAPDGRFLIFRYAPDSMPLILGLGFGLLLMFDRRRSALKLGVILGVVYVTWIFLSPAFQYLSADTRYRLLLPYFQYARMQALYLLLMLMLGLIMVELVQRSKGYAIPILALSLLGAALGDWQHGADTVHKRARAGYCGPMGCMSADDGKVLAAIEEMREQSESEQPVRMLVPNAVTVHGPEKWLMPRGGSRAAVFFDTFPLAFYYYQGDPAYTFDNYQQHVCDTLDVDWLKSQRIKYLFKPSHSGGACLAQEQTLDQRFTAVATSGAARLYRLYD